MHLARHQYVPAQQVVQWLQQFADRSGPATQRGATQLHALTTVYLRLAVMRRVLRELRRDDTRQQASFGRRVSITLQALLISSSCSDTSQPSGLRSPPHAGQAVYAGDSVRVSRGS